MNVDEMLADLRRFYPGGFNPGRIEPMIQGVIGRSIVRRAIISFSPTSPPGKLALFDVLALGNQSIYVFTAFASTEVGAAIVPIDKIAYVQIEEDLTNMTLIFALGNGGAVRLTLPLQKSDQIFDMIQEFEGVRG